MTPKFENSYSDLPPAFYKRTTPTPVSAPEMILFNDTLARELGIDIAWLESPEGLSVFAGNSIVEGSTPLAMAYSGHQFGGFSPQLGDGRAILLGELIARDRIRYDIQLKGSGPTPFSRRGDGRSALGPVLREYLVSEAMAALGVPTTRALSAVLTGEKVIRQGMEPGGVFTRVAKSHIRIGTFQWFAAREDHDNLKVLADYVIDRHYSDVKEAENPYSALLDGVIERQANLIAHWMQLGFIHGVMNTDNMTVSGETIDYGPCAFMDAYHPAKTFSSIDHQGRYAFGNQGAIGHWNLTRFAETLLPLLDNDQKKSVAIAEDSLNNFPTIFHHALQQKLTAKIGIQNGDSDDWAMVENLLAIMAVEEADFTQVFRNLPQSLENDNEQLVSGLFNQPESILTWLTTWRARLQEVGQGEAIALMRRINPIFIPRNHRVEEAIQAGYRGDFSPFRQLHDVLQNPYTEQPDSAEYEAIPNLDEIVTATFCGT